MKLKDLTGKEYGYLKVIKRYGTHIRPSGAKFVTWLCRCCCGKEVVVVGYALKNGTTKSCGCKRFLHPLNETMEDDNFIYISVKDKTVIIEVGPPHMDYPDIKVEPTADLESDPDYGGIPIVIRGNENNGS